MAKVRFVKDTEAKINDAPVADGTIYVSSDTGNMYVDNSDERSQIGIGYTLSKSGSTITLTGEDGSTSSVVDADSTYSDATTSTSGLMSASDKTKLDNLDSTISAAIGEEAAARQKQDQLLEQAIEDKLGADDIIAGSNVQVSHDEESGHVTISATDTKYTAGTGLGLTSTEFYIANGGVGLNQLANDSVSEDKLVDGAVDTAKIAENAVTDSKIASVSADKITGTIPTSILPSYVDDVVEYNGTSAFPPTGESGKIYVDTSTNKTYRWGGSEYVEISPSLALGTTSSTAFRGDYGNIAYQHALASGSAFANGLYKITTNSQGHVTAATAVSKEDITSLGIPGQDTTYSAMKGATASVAGTAGLAPAPAAGAANRYLRSDGTWAVPPDTTYTLDSFGITATAEELNYCDGVTSNIQTQLDSKADASHTHNYLPLSGGTLTGALTSTSITPSADSAYDLGSSSVGYRNVYANTFTGNLTGTATKASQLATARTITLSGDVTGSASFNGTKNITITTTVASSSSGGGTVEVSSSQPTDDGVVLWVKP